MERQYGDDFMCVLVLDAKLLMKTHLEALLVYAEQRFLYDYPLNEVEENDKHRRIQEVWSIGNSFKLTKADMTKVVFGTVLVR